MLKYALYAAVLFQGPAGAQERSLPDRTAAPPNGRYEIVESPVLHRLTFLLDRYEGFVWQLAVNKKDEELWESMHVASPAFSSTSLTRPHEPRFQIFMSGRLARSTYLLDCSTGRVWQYATEKDSEIGLWQPMDKPATENTTPEQAQPSGPWTKYEAPAKKGK